MNKRANTKLFISLHFIVMVAVFISIATGLRMSLVSYSHWAWLMSILPSGQLHEIHYISGLSLTMCIASYLGYRFKYQHHFNKSFYHQRVNVFGYAAFCVAITTGILLWLGVFSTWLTIFHYVSALCVIVYLVLHSLVYFIQLGRQLIKRVFQPRFIVLKLSVLAVLSVGTAGLFQIMNQYQAHVYAVHQISPDSHIQIDGIANEAFWQHADEALIRTHGGANFTYGATDVFVKAVNNPWETYFLFRWADSTKSLTHLPLVKQQGKWQVKQDGFHVFDEKTYYEDKFAVMLSNTCAAGGDNTVHLGQQPLKHKPKNWHGKGYHAALDGKTRDLWHWKALRTNDMVQADDNHFAKPASLQLGSRRYTAGYLADGKESGSYVMNWKWYSPKGVTPKRLPHDFTSHQDVMPWFGSSPYATENDDYKNGAMLPSVLYRSNRFEGDRGDVTAKGHWQDGYWTLEIARKNNTHSNYDVALTTGVCLWVAAFDHAQIAHTRHHRPLQLVYQGALL